MNASGTAHHVTLLVVAASTLALVACSTGPSASDVASALTRQARAVVKQATTMGGGNNAAVSAGLTLAGVTDPQHIKYACQDAHLARQSDDSYAGYATCKAVSGIQGQPEETVQVHLGRADGQWTLISPR